MIDMTEEIKNSIYINYNDTLRKADAIAELAQRLKTQSAARLSETAGNISGIWTGDAAEMYKRKLFEMSERLEGHSNNLAGVSEGLKRSALRLRQLEEAAIAMIEGKK